MKKFSSIIFFLILYVSLIFAHGQGAHQHMVREAYKLLKNYIGQDIREMKDHVGISQTGTAAFDPGNYLVVGAWREDEEDVLYGYDGIGTTCTHFWDPDQGDNSTFNCNS